ncbi:MAG: metal ABC transporter permease [Pirellulaceae bacterium]
MSCLLLAVALLCICKPTFAENDESTLSTEDVLRVVLLRDYNTRVVIAGTGLLGLSAGLIGSFALLRRRALLGDALSHATLPGIGIAFLIQALAGGDGKWMPGLLLGGVISGGIGTLSILGIGRLRRMKEDAALGIVLSVFFGAGIAILVLIQQMEAGHAAGLESFIYGKTASMLGRDAWLIGLAGFIASLIAVVLFKELRLLCFDAVYARSQGFPQAFLDLVLMALIMIVTIVGLQAVGLILIIALLVIPPAAARFWTNRMGLMTLSAAIIGMFSAAIGSAVSALFPRLPSGATIVLTCSLIFLVSMLFGFTNGRVLHWLRRIRLHRTVGGQHLLRAVYEQIELAQETNPELKPETSVVPVAAVLAMRSWSAWELKSIIRRAEGEGWVVWLPNQTLRLTAEGLTRAKRLAHEHRLWELYLITHADIAPSKVDRDADMIEHILQPSMIAELERLLEAETPLGQVPPSPHPLSAELIDSNANQSTRRKEGRS